MPSGRCRGLARFRSARCWRGRTSMPWTTVRWSSTAGPGRGLDERHGTWSTSVIRTCGSWRAGSWAGSSTSTTPCRSTDPATGETMTADVSQPVEHDALILAGGRGTRLGGVDKAALEVGGRSLLSRVLDGVRAARRTVVVGAVDVPDGILRTVEVPQGGGPVAGIAAGLTVLGEGPGWTLVLAVDQPEAGQAVPALLA